MIWGRSLITAREQTRFFLHIDALVPPHHRAYAMELLRTVVHTQRWGIGEVIPAGWTAYFKGGWGSGRGWSTIRSRCSRAAISGFGGGADDHQRRPQDGQGDAARRVPAAAARAGGNGNGGWVGAG